MGKRTGGLLEQRERMGLSEPILHQDGEGRSLWVAMRRGRLFIWDRQERQWQLLARSRNHGNQHDKLVLTPRVVSSPLRPFAREHAL